MNKYEPKPHEKIFGVRPIGVKYICESCSDGEMKSDPESTLRMPNMYPHKCTKCGFTMMLPKVYPYIEWQEITDQDVINETMDLVQALKAETDRLYEEKYNNPDENKIKGFDEL